MRRIKDKSTIEDLHRVVTDKRLERMERLLKWLVVQRIYDDEMIMKENPAYDMKGRRIPVVHFPASAPDISDIIEKSGK